MKPIKTFEELQEYIADEHGEHWLICEDLTHAECSELVSTGSVTLHLADRHFVLSLSVQEVDLQGMYKNDTPPAA